MSILLRLVRAPWLVAALLTAAAASCRSEDGPAPAAPLEAGAAAESAPEAQRPVRTASVQPKVLSGYQTSGAASCFALAEDRRCVVRSDATRTACAKIGGDEIVCEDCTVLCSRPLK